MDDGVLIARAVGLRYVIDEEPGIQRRRIGRGFIFVDPRGCRIRDERTLTRIRALAVPPAWTKVWICPSAQGHIQATGRDARGRKQYRYHASWSENRNRLKFHRLLEFGRALEATRKKVSRDLARRGLGKEKVLAAIVRLLEASLIRIGNEEYARKNHSYGLTTLRRTHAKVSGSTIVFRFCGKAGIERTVTLEDAALARVVKMCQKLGGRLLFKWIDRDGVVHKITSADVNEYLRQIAGGDFTAKTFRTWGGTLFAMEALAELSSPEDARSSKRQIAGAVRRVAERLGNTPAVSRSYYIHPSVLHAFETGTLRAHVERRRPGRPSAAGARTAESGGRRIGANGTASELSRDERALLSLLAAEAVADCPRIIARIEKLAA